MHLTGAYRKLDVSGRADLPAALSRARPRSIYGPEAAGGSCIEAS